MGIFRNIPSRNTGTTRGPHQIPRFLYFIPDNNPAPHNSCCVQVRSTSLFHKSVILQTIATRQLLAKVDLRRNKEGGNVKGRVVRMYRRPWNTHARSTRNDSWVFLSCAPFSLIFLLPVYCIKIICTMMIEVSSEQPRSPFYTSICIKECCCRRRRRRRCCCCCCCSYVLLYCCCAFCSAFRHRAPDGQICCWSIESDPSVCFSSFKRK